MNLAWARRQMGGLSGRVAWGLADQALSSLTNFALSVMVARSATARELGAFVFAFAAYVLVVNIGNGLIGEPLLVRYTDAPSGVWSKAASGASGAALSLGVAGGAACILVGGAIGGTQGHLFIALAIALPGLAVQDTWRKLFFVRLQGKLAFLNDLAWGIALVPALVLLETTGRGSVISLTAAWGAAGTFSGLLGCLQAGVLPNASKTREWLRDHRDLSGRFLAELMLLSGVQQLSFFLIGGVAGLAVLGAVRGAEVILGPLFVIIIGLRMIAMPEAALMLKESPLKMRRALILLAVGLSGAAVLVGAFASLIPASVGTMLLGETWPEARPAVIPVALFMAATGASMSALLGLRALQAGRRSLRARLYAAPLVCGGALGGAAQGSPWAAAAGMAAGMWLGVIIWWRQFGLALEENSEGSR